MLLLLGEMLVLTLPMAEVVLLLPLSRLLRISSQPESEPEVRRFRVPEEEDMSSLSVTGLWRLRGRSGPLGGGPPSLG